MGFRFLFIYIIFFFNSTKGNPSNFLSYKKELFLKIFYETKCGLFIFLNKNTNNSTKKRRKRMQKVSFNRCSVPPIKKKTFQLFCFVLKAFIGGTEGDTKS